jgi:ATP-dependent exoDNAse (exonuclease V) beta subunit
VAVLVRTGREAAAVRRELRRRQVASVYLSDKDSVFNSVEAHDLLRWLRAVASPRDVRLARAALATRSLGLSVAELQQLAADDEAFDAARRTTAAVAGHLAEPGGAGHAAPDAAPAGPAGALAGVAQAGRSFEALAAGAARRRARRTANAG